MKKLISLLCFPITFCMHSTSVLASIIDDQDIATRYNLNIGQYLLSADQKVCIKNWYNPDLDDYKILQDYLSSAPRPELQYLIDSHRTSRMRNFHLYVEETCPKFEILYLNNSKSRKKNCIVTYISFDKNYIKKLNGLIAQLKKIGFDGHLIYRIGGWPATESGSLEFFDVPYAFKIFSILEAKNLGYENCLWLDACLIPLKRLDPIFTHISKEGIYVNINYQYLMSTFIQDFATESFGLSLSDFLKLPAAWAGIIGVSFKKPRGLDFIDSFYEIVRESKLGFLSYIPEQAALCVIVERLKLAPHGGNPNFISFDVRTKNHPETILFWDHD